MEKYLHVVGKEEKLHLKTINPSVSEAFKSQTSRSFADFSGTQFYLRWLTQSEKVPFVLMNSVWVLFLFCFFKILDVKSFRQKKEKKPSTTVKQTSIEIH